MKRISAISLVALLLCFGFSFNANSQTLQDLGRTDRVTYGFHWITSTLVDNSIAYPDYRKKGPLWSFGMDFERYEYTRGGTRFSMRSKAIGDLLWAIGQEFKKEKLPVYGADLSNLFWFNFGWNVLVTDKVVGGLGFHMSDYIIGAHHADEFGSDTGITDPTGWWFTMGPTAYFDILVYKKLTLDIIGNYGYPLVRVSTPQSYVKTDGYPKPGFYYYDIKLLHSSGFYLGFESSHALDKGSFNDDIRRNDFLIGYRLKLVPR